MLAACDEIGIRAEQRRLSVPQLKGAAEVFVTSALRGVVPVTKLDGEERAVGPITARVVEAYLAGVGKAPGGASNDPS